MIREFSFDPKDRQLTLKMYGKKFTIVANSALNQNIIKLTSEALNGDADINEKVEAVFTAIDSFLEQGFSTEHFGEVESACFDEVMSCYNFIVRSMVEFSTEVQKKYSPARIDGEKN